MQNKTRKRNEIRILDVPDNLFNLLIDMAKKEKRSLGKQAEMWLEKYAEQQKLL